MLHALLALFFTANALCAPLPALRLDPTGTTVSGISSGAFMAIQLQVALSSLIHGAGSVAGGIYGCAEGSGTKAQMQCMMLPRMIDAAKFIKAAEEEAKAGRIDSLENLKQARYYLFHSEADATVNFSALASLQAFAEAFTPKAQVKVETVKDAAHAFPTLNYGRDCKLSGSPFIVNCQRDVAGEILTQLYPGLKAPAAEATGTMLAFEQGKYSELGAGMADEGHIYVPKACERGACRLHIALHGCKMNSEFIKGEFREHAGYNRWADTNHLVVLYPEAAKGLLNPAGCWDWYGYTSVDYAVKSGKQILFISKALGALGIH